jgi:hypothetical protein
MASGDLVNHWTEAPEWDVGTRLWSIYITFDTEQALHDLVVDYQSALADVPGLDPVSTEWLHATVQGLEFEDKISEREASLIYEQIVHSLGAPPGEQMFVESPILDVDSVCMPLSGSAAVVGIKDLVTATAGQVLAGRVLYALPEPPDGFNPHITIAYANRSIPGSEIRDRLATVLHRRIPLIAPRVSLIALRREERRWAWRLHRQHDISAAAIAAGGVAGQEFREPA